MQPGTLARSDTQFISGNASVRRVHGMRQLSEFFLLFRQRDYAALFERECRSVPPPF
jgi:hypothetical protein